MRAVQRILGVVECFTPERRALTLQEIADSIELPKSTAFRIVHSLEEAGYLVRLENQRYCLSLRFTRIAGLVKSTLDIREFVRPAMTDLSEKTEETIALYTIRGVSRLCIESSGTSMPLRSVAHPGDQVPLLVGSSSKVLIAHMTMSDLESILPAVARATKRTRQALIVEMKAVRQQGYAISHGELHIGLSGIAAPITDMNGGVRYCLTLSGPTARIQLHERRFIKQVVSAAARISRQFGGDAA
jgi:DNA-binding IclR family transcriptional regulator